MAAPQDPAFWKRFSVAVHLQDEEKGAISDSRSTSTATSTRPPLKHTESWLDRNRKKQRRTRLFGWLIAFGFLAVIAGIVVVLLWYSKVGPFQEKSSDPPK